MKPKLIELCCWAFLTAYVQSARENETHTLPVMIGSAQKGAIEYSEDPYIGPDCSHLDSCGHDDLRDGEVTSEQERNCACDQECSVYEDCCGDSTWIGSRQPDHRFTCVKIAKLGAFFMISRCPPNHSDTDLQEKCERGGIDSDPMGSMPVTDVIKRITYRNIFCAMCHSDSKDKTFWTPKLDCAGPNLPSYNSTEFDIRDLVFNESLEQWTVGVTLTGARITKSCSISPAFQQSMKPAIRSCEPGLVEKCPADWHDTRITWECARYQAARYSDFQRFRNLHCALCNGVNASLLKCKGLIHSRIKIFIPSFSILLDINTAKNGPSVGKIELGSCKTPDQVYDIFLRSCRSLVCGFDQLYLNNGRCVKRGDHKEDEHDDQVTDILRCPKIVLTRHEFILKENGEAFVPLYNRSFNSTNFQLEDDILYVCSSFLDNEVSLNKFSSEMGLVTLIGLGISLLSLVLHIIAFILLTEARNLSGHNLCCLSISLIIAYTSFILMPFPSIKRSNQLCTLTGHSVAYFFLAAIAWMNVISYDVWRSLRMATIELRVSHGKQRTRFIVYSLYAWLISGLFVGAAILTDHLPENYVHEDFRPGFGTFGHCWFQKRRALLLFFAAPIALIMTANLIFFILTTLMIGKTTSVTKSFNQQSVARTNSKLYLKLYLLMGLIWIVGFIASSVDSLYVWYLFIILNTLQGLFIFLTFSCKKISRLIQSKWYHLTISSGSTGTHSIATSGQNNS